MSDSRSAGNPLATWEREVSQTITFARQLKEAGRARSVRPRRTLRQAQ